MSTDKNNQTLQTAKVKAVIIAKSNGVPLATVKTDADIDEELISPFFSAIKQFSENTLDFSKHGLDFLQIKGGEVESLIARNHDLILIALIDKEMKKEDMKEGAEDTLDLFYEMFKTELEKMEEESVDLNIFKKFEVIMKKQIQNYYERIEQDDEGVFDRITEFFKKKLR